MAPVVLEMEHVGVTHRLTLTEGNKLLYSYARLLNRAYVLFRLSSAALVTFAYTNKDGVVVLLADDQDLEDALVLQGLNPLKLTVMGMNIETDNHVGEEQKESITPPPPQDSLRKKRRRADYPTEKDNVHRGIACDGCHESPIKGPRFKSRIVSNYDLCQFCHARKPKVEQAEYFEISRRIYHLVNPVVDVKTLSSAFSPLKKSRAHQEGDSSDSDELNFMQNHGIQCSECFLEIEGHVFQSCKKLNHKLCILCWNRGSGKSSEELFYRTCGSTIRDVPILTNKVIRLQRPNYMPAYVSERSVWLIDPQVVVVDQASVRQTYEELCPSGRAEDMEAWKQAWFPPNKDGYLSKNRHSEQVTGHTFSEDLSVLRYRYPARSCKRPRHG